MDLETFVHDLHYNTDKIFPPDWEVDWEDAPLPYKLYRGLPHIPLPQNVPLTFKRREHQRTPVLEELGQFLWYVYGITQYSQTAYSNGDMENTVSYAQSLRRFVPSGGGLYPNELYVYIKLEDVPEGVYHYDAAHHRLILLREGNYDNYLSKCLGNDLNNSFAAVFVSTMFWKNFYKYNNFSCRLQGLDAGVIIGQSLEAANQMGYSAKVCYQFLDRAINHLLGLSEQDESVYSVITLSIHDAEDDHKTEEAASAAELCREIPMLKHDFYNRSKRVIDFPMLRMLNEASMFESSESFVKIDIRENPVLSPEILLLPFTETFSYDFSTACRNRFSPDLDFIIGRVSQSQLSTLLKETYTFSYKNDLDDTNGKIENRMAVYGSFYNVEGVPNGAYSYDNTAHALHKIAEGDYRGFLQHGLTMPNVNLYQVPLCIHVVGDKDFFLDKMGYRGYRIQQMEAGILVQRLLLLSSALGMGGRPLLGFDVNQCDELYRIDSKGKTSLIQIPIGPHRPRAWLKGSLLS